MSILSSVVQRSLLLPDVLPTDKFKDLWCMLCFPQCKPIGDNVQDRK